jgi:hypothetical protein
MHPEDMKIALAANDALPTVTTITHKAVTIGAASTEVRVANTARRYLLLVNDADEVIYVSLGVAAAANTGIRLNASGGSYEIGRASGSLYTGAIYAICASGSKKLLVTEGI